MSASILGITLKGLDWYANWTLKRCIYGGMGIFCTICSVGWGSDYSGGNGFGLMSSTSFSIIVNGPPKGLFSSSRGLCQGDLYLHCSLLLWLKV